MARKDSPRKPAVVAQRYELVPVTGLAPHPKNPRKGNPQAIDESIAENGFYGAVVAQKSSGYILAGRHRWERAQAAGMATVPVIWADVDDPTALRILVADNRTSDLAGYDEAALAELLESVRTDSGGFEGTGFDEAAYNEILASVGDAILGANSTAAFEDEPPPLDHAEELLAKWNVEPGQIWAIGKHRLMCGDSTSEADVTALMQGERAGLMATDPPYGVTLRLEDNHEASNAAKGLKAKYRHFDRIMGDDLEGDKLQAFLEQCFAAAIPCLKENAAWYLWHAQLSQGFFAAAAAQLLVHRQIISVKPHFVFGRGDYHWQHELCFYGWRQGHRPPFYGERNQSTTWILNEGGGSIRKDQDHPTQKPVELFARPMKNHLKPGEIAYEPFAGSGSQFAAAEQLGIRCYGLEIEAKYVAVICERMHKLGLEPKVIG